VKVAKKHGYVKKPGDDPTQVTDVDAKASVVERTRADGKKEQVRRFDFVEEE